MTLRWTDKPPTEPGLYLYKLAECPDSEIEADYVTLADIRNNQKPGIRFSSACRWAGPIVIAEPEQAVVYSHRRILGQQPEPKETTVRCPKCNSPSPERHPAVQYEGEVEICNHPWHKPEQPKETSMSGLPNGLELWGAKQKSGNWVTELGKLLVRSSREVAQQAIDEAAIHNCCTVRRMFPPELEPPQHPLLAAIEALRNRLHEATSEDFEVLIARAKQLAEPLVAQNAELAEMRAMLEKAEDDLGETGYDQCIARAKEIRELLARVEASQ